MGEQLGSQPIVRIGGTRLAANVAAKLDVVTVETDLVAPGVARLEFSDRDAELLDEIGVALGDQIEVHAAPVGEQQTLRLFTGAVYATEYCADERGGSSVLIAYDAGFVLRQTRGIRSFNEVTDADLVRTICDEVGVKAGQVDATNVTHPYIAQLNETNWDFIQRRAVASDCIVYVDDGALQFRQSPSAADAPTVGDRGSRQPLQLSFGRNVTRLHARNSAAGQTGTVEVRGWDPRAKQAVEATAQPATRSAESKASPAKIGRSLGADRWVTAKSSMTTEPECASLARSVAEVTAAGFAYVDGQTIGDPRLTAGGSVSLGVAGHFDGRYVVSTARHVFDDEGYTTEFVLSGGIDRTLIALVDRHVPERHDGVHPAVVADINDPEQQGRVKLRFPWLNDSFRSNWARVSQVGAGHDRGIWWLPEIDDEVLVAFVDGDVSHPVVVGSLFNGVDLPPLDGYADGGDGLVDVRCLRTRAGHTIEFSDADGGELIRIATGDETITVLLDQANGKLSITTDGDLALETHGATSIVSDGDLSIETQGKLNISSQGAAEINSSSALKLASNGQVDVSGALINLN